MLGSAKKRGNKSEMMILTEVLRADSCCWQNRETPFTLSWNGQVCYQTSMMQAYEPPPAPLSTAKNVEKSYREANNRVCSKFSHFNAL